MSAFSLIDGSNHYDSDEDKDHDFLHPHCVVLTRFVISITMLQGDQSINALSVPWCPLMNQESTDCNTVVSQGGEETYHKLAKYSTFFSKFPP